MEKTFTDKMLADYMNLGLVDGRRYRWPEPSIARHAAPLREAYMQGFRAGQAGISNQPG